MTVRTVPNCDMSRGLLTVAMPESGDFVESLKPYNFCHNVDWSWPTVTHMRAT